MNNFFRAAMHWIIAATISLIISWSFLTSHLTDDTCESKCTARLEKQLAKLQEEMDELEMKR